MRWDIILPIAIAILLALLVFAVLARAFRVAIVALLLAVIIPTTVTVLSGEGDDFVSRFASLFVPAIEQQIKDGYHNYSEAEKENPVLDPGGVEDAFEQFWNLAKDKVTDLKP